MSRLWQWLREPVPVPRYGIYSWIIAAIMAVAGWKGLL